MAELVLMYHNIAGASAEIDFEEWSPVYDVSLRDFQTQVELIAACGHRTELTFDDGYASIAENVLPLIRQKPQMQTRCFITTDALGRVGMLKKTQVRHLAQAGMVIGAHSHTHTFLHNLTQTELQREVAQPKKILEDLLGQPVTSMSLPGGRYDQRTLEFAASCGFHLVYTSRPGVQSQAKKAVPDLRLVPRWAVNSNTATREIAGLLGHNFAAMARWQWRYRLGQAARFMLGQKGYHRLWQRVQNNERKAS